MLDSVTLLVTGKILHRSKCQKVFITFFNVFSNNLSSLQGMNFILQELHMVNVQKFNWTTAEYYLSPQTTAAHYVPSLATHIIRQNKYAISNGRLPIKLASIIIGNGYISPRAHQLSYTDYACDKNRYDKCNNEKKIIVIFFRHPKLILLFPFIVGIDGPLFDAFTCKRMKINRERCEFLWNQCSQGYGSCTAASILCKKTLFDPFHSTSRNPYDIRKRCTHNDDLDSCYDEIRDIEEYVNRQDVKTIYGVDFSAGDFSNCNPQVKTRFDLNMDRYGFTTHYNAKNNGN